MLHVECQYERNQSADTWAESSCKWGPSSSSAPRPNVKALAQPPPAEHQRFRYAGYQPDSVASDCNLSNYSFYRQPCHCNKLYAGTVVWVKHILMMGDVWGGGGGLSSFKTNWAKLNKITLCQNFPSKFSLNNNKSGAAGEQFKWGQRAKIMSYAGSWMWTLRSTIGYMKAANVSKPSWLAKVTIARLWTWRSSTRPG